MNNIKELLKKNKGLKYSNKEKNMLVRKGIRILGKDMYLTICMEEISELIDVSTENLYNKINYIHTAEELADVYVSMRIIKNIYNIKDNKLDKIDKSKAKPNKLFRSISDLSKAQQILSKNIRGKDKGEKILKSLNLINEACEDIISIFKIKKKDINRIEALKYQRLEERIDNRTLA